MLISLKAIPTACLLLLAAVFPAIAEDGVSANKILFGQAAALGGPAGALGQGMKIGMEAAFAEVNKAGGVRGRKLELKSIDDGYEPTQSIEVVKKLLAEDKVFAIAGPVGTPTAMATLPIASAAGAPFIGAFTGSGALRDPYKPLVMNVRASYFEETEAMVASDQGSRRDQDRDHIPGRRVRSGRPRRREAGARQAQDGTRCRGHVRAQYGGGERRAPRGPPGQARRGHHDRAL